MLGLNPSLKAITWSDGLREWKVKEVHLALFNGSAAIMNKHTNVCTTFNTGESNVQCREDRLLDMGCLDEIARITMDIVLP